MQNSNSPAQIVYQSHPNMIVLHSGQSILFEVILKGEKGWSEVGVKGSGGGKLIVEDLQLSCEKGGSEMKMAVVIGCPPLGEVDNEVLSVVFELSNVTMNQEIKFTCLANPYTQAQEHEEEL